MRRFYSVSMNSERQSEISLEEVEDYDNEGDLYSDDDWEEGYSDDEDEEPEEREYCD